MTLNTKTTPNYSMEELKREATIGSMGTTSARSIPVIDFSDYANRRSQIADDLWNAATKDGFFRLSITVFRWKILIMPLQKQKDFLLFPCQKKRFSKKNQP